MVPTTSYLALSGILFALGMIGVLTRRTAIMVFLSVELMLNAANLALVAFARSWGDPTGQTAVFIVMTLAAAEVARRNIRFDGVATPSNFTTGMWAGLA